MQVPKLGPGVRRNKCPLLQIVNGNLKHLLKVLFGNKLQFSKRSQIGFMCDQLMVSLHMFVLRNGKNHLGEWYSILIDKLP